MNYYGETTVPAAASSGVIAITAGPWHTVALKADGSVFAWGYNYYGQTTVPAAASTGVIAITAGEKHTVALKTDGSVVAWGGSYYGQTAVPDCLTAFDYDDDGVCYTPIDNCPFVANSDQLNSDSDTLGDVCDNCPEIENENQMNTDGDTSGDVCDPDDDNDTIPDEVETYLGTNPLIFDSDGDGVNDNIDAFPTNSNYTVDANSNGIPDEIENDINTLNSEIDTLNESNLYLKIGDHDEDGDVDGDDLENFSAYFGNEAIDVDNDGDTFAEIDGDCNDSDPNINPDAVEICDDGIDNDCDGDIDGNDSDCPL